MKKSTHVVWFRASITMIALTLGVVSITTAQTASAMEGESSVNDNSRSIEGEQNTQSNESRDTLRTQQREALEAKKQELRAAQEAAKAQLEAEREANRAARQEKLSASKLEICKNREANINNRIIRIADRSTKHLELFDKISERAQTFYTTSGRTLDNYDELVTDVIDKRTAAATAVESITTTKANFECEGENPKVTIEEFKLSLKSSVDVLKEYRTSVKNLIVGIKSAQATANDDGEQAGEVQ